MVLTIEQEAALEGVARTSSNEFVTSTGVHLKLKRVAPMIVSDAARRMKAPKPPMIQIEGKSRAEENPNDPDYLAALEQFEYDRGFLAVAVYLTMGTEIIRPLPEGISDPDDDDWVEVLNDIVELDVPTTGRKRYLAWLKYVVLADSNDVTEVMQKIMRLGGVVQEVDVADAIESFRSDEGRRTDSRVRTTTEDQAEPGDAGDVDSADVGHRSERDDVRPVRIGTGATRDRRIH